MIPFLLFLKTHKATIMKVHPHGQSRAWNDKKGLGMSVTRTDPRGGVLAGGGAVEQSAGRRGGRGNGQKKSGRGEGADSF